MNPALSGDPADHVTCDPGVCDVAPKGQVRPGAEQKPSVGRMVHYVSYGTPGGEYKSLCRAAVVSEVDPGDDSRIGLVALNPTGMFFHALADGGCEYHEGDVGHDHSGAEIPARSYRGGSWHWPERV